MSIDWKKNPSYANKQKHPKKIKHLNPIIFTHLTNLIHDYHKNISQIQ